MFCDLKGADRNRVRSSRKKVGGIETYHFITLAVPTFPLRIKDPSAVKSVLNGRLSKAMITEIVSLATSPKLK